MLSLILPLIILTTVDAFPQEKQHCIRDFPYSESFEYMYGRWSQGSGDDFDWMINTGLTPSDHTGPLSAYDGDCYIYTRASDHSGNRQAVLISPCFDLSELQEPVLSFAYNMFGEDMGSLEVLASPDGGLTWTQRVCYYNGDKGNAWYVASFDLRRFRNRNKVMFKFIGTTGEGPRGDLALDYVHVGNRGEFEFKDNKIVTGRPLEVKVRTHSNRLAVELPDECIYQSSLEMINLLGRKVYNNHECSSSLISVDITGLDEGLYFLRVYHRGETVTRKVYIK